MLPPEAVRRARLWLYRLLVPSFVDLFFIVLLFAAFVRPGGLESLLADGDTGWHIRTGELVLATGAPPLTDPFSFTRAGERWFAWEWLADTLFAAVYGRLGLAGVAMLSALVLSLAAAVLFAWLQRRECGLWISAAVTLAAVSASSVHYLARPHVFSILLYTVSLWLLDEHRRGRRLLLWLLPPVCAVWANLHAGFVVLPATLVLATLISLATYDFAAMRRFGAVTLACGAASLVNPYGWRLHQHILSYLDSSWILEHVQEFQSPNIRSEGMVMFVVLLLAGVALAARSLARRHDLESALVFAWSFAALRSARHIPLFAIAAAPVVATEGARWLRRKARVADTRSLWRPLCDLGREFGQRRHATLWIPLTAVVVFAGAGWNRQLHFPSGRFPVQVVNRQAALLAPGTGMPRILSSDQWADYLIFRLYPRQRVFFDGRSDFYGPHLGADYRVLQSGTANWRELLDRYRFDLALLPREWPLSTMLDREPGWRLVYQDQVAVLVERMPGWNTAAHNARGIAP